MAEAGLSKAPVMSRARPVSKVPGGKALNKIGLQAGCRTGRPKKDGAISRAQTGQGPPKFDRSLTDCVLREGIQPASRPAQLKRTFYTESLNYLQMYITSEALERAVEELARLPGTGRKSARRIAIYLLKQSDERVFKLADALTKLKTSVHRCSVCGTITDHDPCSICSSEKRKNGVICVVEEFQDVDLIEKTNEFRGRYHVLGGTISPLDNIGPDDIRVKELLERLADENEPVHEVILALNPDSEGEATSYYINKLLEHYDVNVTRIAYGIPMGTELEYIDEATLSRAFASRTTF